MSYIDDKWLEEAEAKVRALRSESRPDVLAGAFPAQLECIRDPAGLKVEFCTRRAAKTFTWGLEAVDDGYDYPGANYLFVGLDRMEAKRIFWKDVLQQIDDTYKVGMKFNKVELSATLPTGAVIYLVGADQNEHEQRKLYGGKYRKIGIDEGQEWRRIDLRQLVFQVLKPSVADWRGSISVMGTPGNHTTGFFHDLTRGCIAGKLGDPAVREPGWSVHTWTTFQNPYMAKQWQEEIDDLIAANPRVAETPWFRQMYMGEWVVDVSARCYRFDRTRNVYTKLPVYEGGRWHFVLGIDIGYSPDPCAFVLGAYHDYDHRLYLIESWKQWKMDVTDIAHKVKEFDTKVRIHERESIEFFIIDGANKTAVEEMRRRHMLDLQPADKRGKEDFIEMMNSEFILAQIMVNLEGCSQGLQNGENADKKIIQETLSLADEYEGLIWDPSTIPGNPKWRPGMTRKEHPRSPNHLCDAALYLWRWTYTYLAEKPKDPPKTGTNEWFAAEAERMRVQAELELEARKAMDEKQGLGDSSEWDPNLQ